MVFLLRLVDVHVVFHCPIMIGHLRSEMALNYGVIVERYPFHNEVVGGSILALKSSL